MIPDGVGVAGVAAAAGDVGVLEDEVEDEELEDDEELDCEALALPEVLLAALLGVDAD